MTDVVNELERPIAFVFSGGASLAASEVGMARALFEAGIEPDLVVGASAGALNAAFLAADPTVERVRELDALWRSIRREDVFPGRWLSRLALFLIDRNHLFASDGLRALLESALGSARRIEDFALPLGILAARLPSGLPKVFTRGPLIDALLASSAIPGALPPVRIDGVDYVDGGIVTVVPLAPALAMGARSFVVLDPGPPCALGSEVRGLAAFLANVFAIGTRQRLAANLPLIAASHRVVYIGAPCTSHIFPLDFSHASWLIEAGYESARRILVEGWPDGPGYVGEPHYHDHPSLASTWGLDAAKEFSSPGVGSDGEKRS